LIINCGRLIYRVHSVSTKPSDCADKCLRHENAYTRVPVLVAIQVREGQTITEEERPSSARTFCEV